MDVDIRPSLYDRLGGVYNIATVIDDFIDLIMHDDRLNKNPAVNEAHHRVSPAGFEYLVTEMVCWAAGGPQQYSRPADGRCASRSLARFEVPEAEEAELVAIVESTRDAIVVAPLQPTASTGSGPPR